MRRLIAAGLVGALSFGSAPVYAQNAMLTDLRGDVLLNRGDGFLPVSSPSSVAIGDRVTVSENAGARLIYGDGCSIQLKPRSVTTVSAASLCAQITPAADVPEDLPEDPVAPTGPESLILPIVGLAAFGGLVACLVEFCDDDDGRDGRDGRGGDDDDEVSPDD